MKRDEHKAIIQNLLGMVAPEHQAAASEALTNLSEDYEQVLTESETATANVATLTANNETLREVNAKLFLKVGQTEKENHKDDKPEQKPETENKLTYEALFNEKGELI